MRLMDAGAGGRCELLAMGASRCLRLVLELEQGRDPVRGWLRGPDGTRERFEGLLGLLAALDAARSSERGGTDGETSPLGTAEHPEG